MMHDQSTLGARAHKLDSHPVCVLDTWEVFISTGKTPCKIPSVNGEFTTECILQLCIKMSILLQ